MNSWWTRVGRKYLFIGAWCGIIAALCLVFWSANIWSLCVSVVAGTILGRLTHNIVPKHLF